jgi:hypothetical protein
MRAEPVGERTGGEYSAGEATPAVPLVGFAMAPRGTAGETALVRHLNSRRGNDLRLA